MLAIATYATKAYFHCWPQFLRRIAAAAGHHAEAHFILATDQSKEAKEAIEAARSIFPSCDFDEVSCAQGLKRLQHYRKEWDDQRGVWKDRPRHDDNSNGADAFQTFATGFAVPFEEEEHDEYDWGGQRNGTTGY